MMLRLTVMVVALLAVVEVRAAFNEPDWAFQSYLNEDYTLECNHSSLEIMATDSVKWALPNKIQVSSSTAKYRLINGMNGQVSNMFITINDVQESDTGVYVCHVFNSQMVKRGQLLRGLNMGGHKYKVLFDKYRHNLIVAVIAAAVLFIPMVTLCFLYKFRYQTKEQKREKHEQRMDLTRHRRHLENADKGSELPDRQGKANPGYDDYEEGTRL